MLWWPLGTRAQNPPLSLGVPTPWGWLQMIRSRNISSSEVHPFLSADRHGHPSPFHIVQSSETPPSPSPRLIGPIATFQTPSQQSACSPGGGGTALPGHSPSSVKSFQSYPIPRTQCQRDPWVVLPRTKKEYSKIAP